MLFCYFLFSIFSFSEVRAGVPALPGDSREASHRGGDAETLALEDRSYALRVGTFGIGAELGDVKAGGDQQDVEADFIGALNIGAQAIAD
jgi:hypothetical protein